MNDPGPAVVRRIKPAFSDARGTISDILEGVPISAVTIITTKAGAVRGNHYHLHTQQYLYMLEGRMRVTTRIPGGPTASIVIQTGDLILQAPREEHAVRALDDTTFLVLTAGPRAGSDFESDTFRLAADDLLEHPG